MLRPGVREHEIVARAMQLLFELGSEQVEAINAVSGDRCNPHPHVFSDRLLRPGDQAFFDVIHSFMGYRTCYYRTFNVGGVTRSQIDAYKQCREWLDERDRARAPRRHDRPDRERLADRGGARLPRRAVVLRPAVRARPRRRPLRGADDLARPLARPPDRDRGGHGVRPRDVLRRERRRVRSPHRGGGRRHRDGLPRSSRSSRPRSCSSAARPTCAAPTCSSARSRLSERPRGDRDGTCTGPRRDRHRRSRRHRRGGVPRDRRRGREGRRRRPRRGRGARGRGRDRRERRHRRVRRRRRHRPRRRCRP